MQPRAFLFLLRASVAYVTQSQAPFYVDPLFSGSHDAELVFNYAEGCWWMLYLQNRYNSPLVDPHVLAFTSLTDIGLASSPDGGHTWIYRGVARGLDVPSQDRRDPLPIGSSTQQYGGATWWRPAVKYLNGTYHGFFVYWEPGQYQHFGNLVHYTSVNLKDWKFQSFLRNGSLSKEFKDNAYDSTVFQIADGRFILMSTGQEMADAKHNMPPVLQSRDLYNWEPCPDPDLHFIVSEGPHVTFNDATRTWHGYSWLNYDGSPGHIARNVLRSKTGGLSWELSPHTLFDDAGPRDLDGGPALQGPIFFPDDSNPEPEGYVLYFTEFDINGSLLPSIGHHRSVLQVAKVSFNATGDGFLSVNRSESFKFVMRPPRNADENLERHHSSSPLVWSIAEEEALVITLAEINRWFPGWYVNLTQVASNHNRNVLQWRNPAEGARFFPDGCKASRSSGAVLEWECDFRTIHATNGEHLALNATIASNGTIVRLVDAKEVGRVFRPLRQFRFDPPFNYAIRDQLHGFHSSSSSKTFLV